jgi:hypothetical protein
MTILLQIDFPFQSPWGTEMSATLQGIAESIAREPGLLREIRTENTATGEAGGIYRFADRPRAEACPAIHTARLVGFAVPHVDAKLFDVNRELLAIDRAPPAVTQPLDRP